MDKNQRTFQMDKMERPCSEPNAQRGCSSMVPFRRGMTTRERKDLVRVFADDPIFTPGNALAKELTLDPNCAKNFRRLAQGYRGFPLVMLMNPCDRHTGDFGDMLTTGSAILWLKEFFNDIGLDFEYDVSILDMFSLLCDHWLQHNVHGGKHAETHQLILRSCNVTQELLEFLNPPTIIVMHCATNPCAVQRHPLFGSVQHPLVESLSSSMEKAEWRKVQSLNVCGREVPVIPAFHPSRINYESNFEEKDRLTALLRDIMFGVFLPYV
jgi:hypothetical protein